MIALETYKQTREKIIALSYSMAILSWDSETEAKPGSMETRGRRIGVLSKMYYDLSTDKEYKKAIEELFDNKKELDEITAHEIEVTKESNDRLQKIPKEEYAAYSQLLNDCYSVYVEAKLKSDFSIIQPYYEKIVDFQKRYIDYVKTDKLDGYNLLLNDFERGMTETEYDNFFGLLKKDLVPFVKKILNTKLDYNREFQKYSYDSERQRKFCEYIMNVMCFDNNCGLMKESEHPFTNGYASDDVRITTHYYDKMLSSSIFSVIHETGHAIYEQQIDKSLGDTFCSGGVSMGVHESQSRFFENIIGRSREFWENHYPKLQSIFPEELKTLSLDDWVKHINEATRGFIRTEADELTYPIHIMLRYDMEREIFEKGLAVKDFPRRWNELFYDYFGEEVKSDKEGVLQDVHWAYGNYGYFPTYALGTAYAAQLFQKMNGDFNVFGSLKDGTTKQINLWLKEKIHRFGSSKYPKDIIEYALGGKFEPKYYIDYLTNKYSKLYNIK